METAPNADKKPEVVRSAGPDRAAILRRLENALDTALEVFPGPDVMDVAHARLHRRMLASAPPEKKTVGPGLIAAMAFDPRRGDFVGREDVGQAIQDAVSQKLQQAEFRNGK